MISQERRSHHAHFAFVVFVVDGRHYAQVVASLGVALICNHVLRSALVLYVVRR